MVASPRVYYSAGGAAREPPVDKPDLYLTLTEDVVPASLERGRIRAAAHDCILSFGPASMLEPLLITMTLDTRDDGTLMEATYEGATLPLGTCLTELLKKVPLHEEGREEHIVVLVTASR